MIHIYHYPQTVILMNNKSSGTTNLEHSNMFNDKITLYKNMDNPIIFKIRNRDRVSQNLTNVSLTVLNSNKVIVLQTYLELEENDKIHKVMLSKELINNLNPDEQHYFSVYFTDEDNNIIPLYVDHDFTFHGTLIVKNSSAPISTTSLEITKKVDTDNIIDNINDLLFKVDKQLNVVMAFDGKLSVPVDASKVLSVQATFTSNTPKSLYVLKHKGRHYPVDNLEAKQWTVYRAYHEVEDYQLIEKLPTGLYSFMYVATNGYDVARIIMEHIE